MTAPQEAKPSERGNARKLPSLGFRLTRNGEVEAFATGLVGIGGLVLLVLAVTVMLAT